MITILIITVLLACSIILTNCTSNRGLISAEKYFFNFDGDASSCYTILVEPEKLKKKICDAFKKENEMDVSHNY